MNYAFVKLLQYVPNCIELVQENYIEIVYQLLCREMVSPNRFIADDFLSPLSLACEKGHLQMTKLIWMFGVSVKPEIEICISRLQTAVRGGQVEVIRGCWVKQCCD